MTIFVSLYLFAAASVPQSGTRLPVVDESVQSRLDDRGLKYTIDADGDFKVAYAYKNEGRSQLVFVKGKSETVRGLIIREIFSPAARLGKDGIGAEQALLLLNNSQRNKLGSWEVQLDALYFVIKLPDTLSAEQLEVVMDIAAETADNMEKQISGIRDEL
jgi:hypothetical protein